MCDNNSTSQIPNGTDVPNSQGPNPSSSQPPTKPIDRIAHYRDMKAKIEGECEEALHSLLGGVIGKLVTLTLNDIGLTLSPFSPEWVDAIKSALLLLPASEEARRDQPGFPDVSRALRELEAFTDNTGITLVAALADADRMAFDELAFTFVCPPWERMFEKELNSTVRPLTEVRLWLALDAPRIAIVAKLDIRTLDYADVQVVSAKFQEYWQEALAWGKYRYG